MRYFMIVRLFLHYKASITKKTPIVYARAGRSASEIYAKERSYEMGSRYRESTRRTDDHRSSLRPMLHVPVPRNVRQRGCAGVCGPLSVWGGGFAATPPEAECCIITLDRKTNGTTSECARYMLDKTWFTAPVPLRPTSERLSSFGTPGTTKVVTPSVMEKPDVQNLA